VGYLNAVSDLPHWPFLMMHKNGQQNDDRERNADQPKQ
jgi:hypothetical protein